MKTVNYMLILDFDGVISSLKEKKASSKIINHIYQELVRDIPIAINTGRSIETVLEKAINLFTKNKSDKSFLNNLLIVGEKGGTWMTFASNGNALEHIDSALKMPQYLIRETTNIINLYFPHSMFLDQTKKTMISTEMHDGYSIRSYLEDQKLLLPKILKFIKDNQLDNHLKAEPSQIALDIQDKKAGKHLGVKRLMNWLKDKKLQVNSFTTIGDNESDVKMAQELYENHFPVTHVHVGGKKIEQKYPFKIQTTVKLYEQGTEEFLRTL